MTCKCCFVVVVYIECYILWCVVSLQQATWMMAMMSIRIFIPNNDDDDDGNMDIGI